MSYPARAEGLGKYGNAFCELCSFNKLKISKSCQQPLSHCHVILTRIQKPLIVIFVWVIKRSDKRVLFILFEVSFQSGLLCFFIAPSKGSKPLKGSKFSAFKSRLLYFVFENGRSKKPK